MARRVLVVDDEVATREICRTILEHYGFEVVEAADGEEAVQRARGEHPDAIVMDVGLPGLDGWEATRLLKADPQTAGIPVVALTAYAFPDIRERSAEVGCDAYLEKPIEPRRIAETVQQLVDVRVSGPPNLPSLRSEPEHVPVPMQHQGVARRRRRFP